MAFSLFDKDRDGRVTVGEVRQVMLALGHTVDDERLEELFMEVDIDGESIHREEIHWPVDNGSHRSAQTSRRRSSVNECYVFRASQCKIYILCGSLDYEIILSWIFFRTSNFLTPFTYALATVFFAFQKKILDGCHWF